MKATTLSNPAAYGTDYEIVDSFFGNQSHSEEGKNNNKWFMGELHRRKDGWVVYTNYGRVGDPGVHQIYGPMSEMAARKEFADKRKDKLLRKKDPYLEVALAECAVGSLLARGRSVGHIDAETLARRAAPTEPVEAKAKAAPKPAGPTLDPELRAFVADLFGTSKKSLESQAAVTITAKGMRTPAGVLTIASIKKGEEALEELIALVQKQASKGVVEDMAAVSSAFFSAIPHDLGRKRPPVLSTLNEIGEKQELCQLMRDMLAVNGGETGGIIASDDVGLKYAQLGCEVRALGGAEMREVKAIVEKSVIRGGVTVRRVYAVRRPAEWAAFEATGQPVGNVKYGFHGSGFPNWTGILTRGLLMPALVVAHGGKLTDFGWLGRGKYFGKEACTARNYAQSRSPGGRGTYVMAVCGVALGKQAEYRKITRGLTRPPAGADSCWGVRGSEFSDNEWVVYNVDKNGSTVQSDRIEYVVEFN